MKIYINRKLQNFENDTNKLQQALYAIPAESNNL